MIDAKSAHGMLAETDLETMTPTVRQILSHLCGAESGCRDFGFVMEWCEARGDCAYAVVCPGCSTQFLVDDEELADLQRWTDDQGHALVCGVHWD